MTNGTIQHPETGSHNGNYCNPLSQHQVGKLSQTTASLQQKGVSTSCEYCGYGVVLDDGNVTSRLITQQLTNLLQQIPKILRNGLLVPQLTE